MVHVIKLRKNTQRRVDPATIGKQIDRIERRALSAGRAKRWSLSRPRSTPEPVAVDGGWAYGIDITAKWSGRATADANRIAAEFGRLCEVVEKAASVPGWTIGDAPTPAPRNAPTTRAVDYSKCSLPADISPHFAHIYDREAQIALVRSAVDAAIASNFENRFHAVLWGPPACGKTEVLNTFARVLGEEAVLRFDCTSTTKAGAEKQLLEAATVPPILICEEIEKTDENSLRYLLGLLDHRAEIRKVNARVGVAHKKIKLLTLATVNDFPLFAKLMDGALASRFSHKIHCPRPSREVLERILSREIARFDGDTAWIKPAIDYAVDEERTNDPRRIVTICLSGREKLLTGEYQEFLRKCAAPNVIRTAQNF